MKVIDLFSGCGGFSTGFSQAGFEITRAVEFDKQIADSFIFNHQDVEMIIDDIRNIDRSGTFENGECDVIIGGPPCQGFSMAGARIRNDFIDDPRNYLFKHYYNVVCTVKPKIFVMENVKGLLTMENGRIFNEIVSSFENMNGGSNDSYHVYHKIIKASNYGIPQSRERVVVIGVLGRNIDLDYEMDRAKERIRREHSSFFSPCTVWDAISNLGPTSDSGIVKNNAPETDYQKYLASDSDILCNHTKTSHSPEAIERMEKIGCGENFTVLEEKINSVHSGSYGRLQKGGLARTITTRFDTPSGGMFIHPTENRTISPREAARIQSFPDSYVFKGTKTSICKQIGNAVPPKIALFLANVVMGVLYENR